MAANGPVLSTAALRRLKKKKQKEREESQQTANSLNKSQSFPGKFKLKKVCLVIISFYIDVNGISLSERAERLNVEIEYISAQILPSGASEFSEIFEKFRLPTDEELKALRIAEEAQSDEGKLARYLEQQQTKSNVRDDSDEDEGQEVVKDSSELKLSRRKLKKLLQMSLASLKEYCRKPELVEWEDVTAKDPKFLINLKCVRNSVPVPKHWNRKRKYLAGKRGFVKPPFELPAFIKATGIGELRDAMREQDSTKNTKVRAREKMHPKMGRMSIDYERLHDAFFLHQTKPPLTKHGEVYHEGKELEGRLKDKRPGFLSEELRMALGMTSLITPPPWIFQMQKYGPPPSYPHLRIPGLNAPIPEGAQWGFHPGGWGKPPVNDPSAISFTGRLAAIQERTCPALLEPINKNIWGEFEPEEEEELPIEESQEDDRNQLVQN